MRLKHWPVVGLEARFEWEPRDLWVGVFWRHGHRHAAAAFERFDAWLCLVPCVPLHLTWYWERVS